MTIYLRSHYIHVKGEQGSCSGGAMQILLFLSPVLVSEQGTSDKVNSRVHFTVTSTCYHGLLLFVVCMYVLIGKIQSAQKD